LGSKIDKAGTNVLSGPNARSLSGYPLRPGKYNKNALNRV
jgi:hypothetical protein